MIEWCNTNVGFVTTILTLVYVVATLVIVAIMIYANKLTRESTKVAIDLERERTRPVVTFDFFRESVVWNLRVKNNGLSVARDIKFSITPEPKMCFGGENAIPKEKKETGLPLLINGIPSLPPAGEITAALGMLARMKESLGSLRFRGNITYSDELGSKYNSPVDIDLGVHESLTHVSRKGLHEIGTELEKIQKEMNHLATGFSKPKVLTQDIKEYRQEQEEQFQQARETIETKQKAEQAGQLSSDGAPSEEVSA